MIWYKGAPISKSLLSSLILISLVEVEMFLFCHVKPRARRHKMGACDLVSGSPSPQVITLRGLVIEGLVEV